MVMKKALVLGGLACLVIGVSGCGSEADQLLKEQIRAMNELADAVEAKAPAAKVTELQDRLREITTKWKGLNLSDRARRDLLVRHQEELAKAGMRLGQVHLARAAEQTKAITDRLQELRAGTKPAR